MVVRTLVLKLHKPSATKKELIDLAISRYNRALSYLFEHTKENVEPIMREMQEGGAYRTRRITALLQKEMMERLNEFGVQPFKDALKLDYAMAMVAWLSLRKTQKRARYPQILVEEGFDQHFFSLLELFDQGEISREELRLQFDRMYNGLGIKKPLFFGRYAKNRDYCLLYDEIHGRFYAKLYLLGVKDEKRRGGIRRGTARLRYVLEGGEPLEEDNKRERYIVVPLSFGKTQEAVLRKGLENPHIFKTARLLRKNGEYYLSVNVTCEYAQEEKSETYMGITRSLKDAVRYTVTDLRGKVIAEGGIPFGGYLHEKNGMHAAANKLVEIAGRHKSSIITYRMGNIGDKLTYDGETAKLTAGEFNRLIAMTAYKAEMKGLKKPVFVSARGIFTTCPRCGANTQKNRFPGGRLMCIKCGFAGELEKTGPLNAARRLLKYNGTAFLFFARQSGGKLLIYNDILGISYLAQPTQEGIRDFFCYIEKAVKEMKRKGNIQNGMSAREISYRKRFMNLRNVREEITVVDES
ncbi:hypothetical protein [Christensenella tenuis]|uniref:Transposase n=1 Tax=Christensenella tenuis TaxID=2763033 RepID=A0ABR7EI46_9FIRM|nr:hypothetical protein [Christensenella tenuis]MBC5649450.1 hypothetical protein [Christensenella tenuis]